MKKVLQKLRQIQLWRFGWHFLFAALTLLGIIFLIASLAAGPDNADRFEQIGWVLLIISFSIGFFALLVLLQQGDRTIKENSDQLENVSDMINRNNNLLTQVAQSSKLSDTAKEIAYRDIERMELAEAVIAKLHQHEFDATFAMIDIMDRNADYKSLAGQLRKTAEQYRNATEKERIRHAINHILKLGREYRWAQAFQQADNLTQAFPYDGDARDLKIKLRAMKDSRKKELLAMWDDAVKAKDTDKSLDILKELDMYLTPSEGLALQESASSVFRTKLHNLGVRFALAVTENRWKSALETGQQIVREFPNSRMSHEIRGKFDVLQIRAKNQAEKQETTESQAKA